MISKQQPCKFFIRMKKDASKASGYSISSYARDMTRPRNIIRIRVPDAKNAKSSKAKCKAH